MDKQDGMAANEQISRDRQARKGTHYGRRFKCKATKQIQYLPPHVLKQKKRQAEIKADKQAKIDDRQKLIDTPGVHLTCNVQFFSRGELLNIAARVKKAIREHIIQKTPCAVCGRTKLIHAHHHDYYKPLEVIFLCAHHHMLLHGTIYRMLHKSA